MITLQATAQLFLEEADSKSVVEETGRACLAQLWQRGKTGLGTAETVYDRRTV
jgi:hypothetical protein